jgi:hypothetical protein
MSCNPSRWLWGLIPIAMLTWIAYHREVDRIEADLTRRAEARAAPANVAINFTGRDGVIRTRVTGGEGEIALDSVRSGGHPPHGARGGDRRGSLVGDRP